MPKVLIVQPIAHEGIEPLLAAGYHVEQLNNPGPQILSEKVTDADAILVRNAKIPRSVIEKGKKLKVISRHGAGLETIDLEAATEHGVYVTNTPVANSLSVAEHVMGMMLALSKNFLAVDRGLRATGRFDVRDDSHTFELAGKTLGIIGLGNVGRRLAMKAFKGLDMRVIGFDPYIDQNKFIPHVKMSKDPANIFQESDFVSLHLPLNDQTKGSVGLNQFRMMKPNAFIINCARGAIIRELELVEALEQGLIAGAGIDVYNPYVPGENHPLFAFDNVILTPHSAAFTDEALINMATQAAQGIIEVLSGKDPTWPANRIDNGTIHN